MTENPQIMQILETALLPNQSYKKWEVKLGIPQFLYCGYVCLYVCVYVSSPQPTLFELGTWNLDIVLC